MTQAQSALVGGLGAAASERGAEVIAGILYPDKDIKDLSQEERQQISALSQLATGLAIAAMGRDIQDINTGVAAGKNAVENNGLVAITAKPLLRDCFKEQICKKQVTDAIISMALLTGIVLTEADINSNTIEKYIDYLDIPTGFIDAFIPNDIGSQVTITAVDVLVKNGLSNKEAEEFLSSLTSDQISLIRLASVDPIGDGFFKDAVLKTYERYYNDYLKEKDNDNTLTGTGSSTAGGAPGLPPDDNDKNNSETKNEYVNYKGKLEKGDKIDLKQFNKRVSGSNKKGEWVDPKTGWRISPERSSSNPHGGSAWKLFDKAGNRMGTLNENGVYLRP